MVHLKIDTVETSGTTLRIENNVFYIEGNIACNDPKEFFEPFIQELHNQLVENRLERIDVTLQNLKFANSRSLACIQDWVLYTNNPKKYTINVICRNVSWQTGFMENIRKINEMMKMDSMTYRVEE